ncbi:MAG: hypothetical protein RLZZ182_2654, partial [Pseudomonadota bacterium]
MILQAFRPVHWPSVTIALAALLLAPLLGMLAGTGNIMLAGGALGLLLVVALMSRPAVSIWVILVLPLGLSGFLALGGGLAGKATWLVSVLSIILLLPSLVTLFWERKAPAYIWWALGFMAYAVLVTVADGVGPKQLLAGFKRYFQGHGLMFALAVLTFSGALLQRWRRFFTLLAFAQLPMALFQLLVLVPLRGGFSVGSEVTDVVAGTFGGSLVGGSNNSDLALFQITALGFMLALLKEGVMPRQGAWWKLLCVAAPLAMGETKVVVIMLPLCVAMVYLETLARKPLQLLIVGTFTTAITLALAQLYAQVLMDSSLELVVEDTIRYNFQEVGYGQYLLNRWTSLQFWWTSHPLSNLHTFLFGHGLSASYTSMMPGDSGTVAARYPGLGIDLTAVTAMLWDLGLFGLLLFVLVMALAIWHASQLAHRSRDARTRAEALGVRAGLVLILLYL